MEGGERMDIIRKKRTDSSRKPRLGGAQTFMNEHDHSSASGSPPSDLLSVAGFDKVSNEDAGKHSNHNSSHVGDDYRRKFGNNNNKGKLETGKNDLGRSKNINRRAGGGAGDEDWDDMKRVRRDVAELNGNSKHRGMEDDRNYDRKHERGGGSKSQDYGRNKQVEKPSREKSYRNGSQYDKDSKENSMGEKGGERDRRFFGETFKRKMRADDLDRSTWSRDGGMERKQSYDRHFSHEKSVRDRDRERDRDRDRDREKDRDRDRERNHDGAPRGRSRDVQGNSKSGDGGHRAVVVGLSAVGGSLDCHNSDGHKVPDKRSSDAHTMSQAKGGSDSAHGAGHTGLQDGGRKADGHHMGQSKSENTDIKAPESLNVGQVKAGPDGKTYDIREPMDKPTHRQDDPHSKENRVTTVKLKVSGVTHTIHANLAPGNKQKGAEGPSASGRPPQAPEGGRRRQRLILQENSDDEDDYPPRVEKYLQGSLRKESPANCSSSATKMDMNRSKEDRRSKLADESTSGKWVEAGSQPVRKSSRIPKKRVLDGEIDDDEEAEEATQRKSSRTPKKRMQNGEYDEDREEGETLQRKSSRMPKKRMLDGEYDEVDGEEGAQRQKKKQKKSRTGREPEDMYGEYEEEVASDDGYFENSDMEHEGRKNSKRKEALNSTIDEKKEISLTARQRALQSCKDVDTEVGANLIEFPEGLPQTCQRKKKENLSEVEQQLKKAEAAQRRKQQVERAANAQQAEAIKKILGTDSSRKKKEDKLRKQRDEKEQEKSASAMILAPNSVRWVMRPSGTVVSFAQDSGFPSIFNSAPCRYPPAREKCAGPLCNNSYKYRDSKSNLPLCSLQCYRAIHDATHPVSTC